MGGPHDAVDDCLLEQDLLDLGQRHLDFAAAGARVGDDHHGAERAGHGRRPRGFMMPAGSRAALILSRTAAPVSPSSALRYLAFRRPTPWWWVIVPPACSHRSAAWSQAARYRASASWSSAPLIRNVQYSGEPDRARSDRRQPTA